MDGDLEIINAWVEERQQKKKKKKKLSPKYIIAVIVVLVLIVIVWVIVNYTCKKDKEVYIDIDTGEVIDLEAEKNAGTEIIFE